LVSSSLFLVLNSGLQAGAGFIFWIVSTHVFSVSDVGLATSLVSAAAIIAFLSLLGLNSTVVRYLPGAENPNALITSTLLLVATCSAVIAFVYILIIPVVSPRLAFVTDRPALALGFIGLTAAGSLNLLTDSIFIGLRKASYNALVDGGFGGVTKILAAVVVAGSGAYGLFFASSIGYVVAAMASLAFIASGKTFRPSLRGSGRLLKPLLRFSGANYVGNMLTLLPTYLVPLIVLDRIGVHATAYYYIAYQLVGVLFAGVFAVEQSFLAEGSQNDVDLRAMMRRSFRLLSAVCVPSSLALAGAAHWLLLLFGGQYSKKGTEILVVLAIAVLPMGAFYWFLTVLRLTGQLTAIVLSNVVFAAVTCGSAWLLAPRGISVLVFAWPIGLCAAAMTAAFPVYHWSHWGRHAAGPGRDAPGPGRHAAGSGRDAAVAGRHAAGSGGDAAVAGRHAAGDGVHSTSGEVRR
jgi:O-antigen/teichoic acid export membrane protein